MFWQCGIWKEKSRIEQKKLWCCSNEGPNWPYGGALEYGMIPQIYPKLRHKPKSFIYINLDGSILYMGFPERRLTQPGGFLQLGQSSRIDGSWGLSGCIHSNWEKTKLLRSYIASFRRNEKKRTLLSCNHSIFEELWKVEAHCTLGGKEEVQSDAKKMLNCLIFAVLP